MSTTARIPSFIKSVCNDYANNMISETEFINCLQWLITNKILIVPEPQPTAPAQQVVPVGTVHTIPVGDGINMGDKNV